MPTYSQDNRPLKLDTPLGRDVLLLTALSGLEAVSSTYEFHLQMISEDADIAADDILRKPVCVTVQLVGGGERRIHGIVRRFVQLGREGDVAFYQADVVPWLWFLSLSRESRIFQNLSVPEIIEQVFQSQGYSDFELKCKRSYAKREYCVQYRESHLNFISRLMEEEGIFYFFQHTDSKHTLVVTDANATAQACPGPGYARMAPDGQGRGDEDYILRLSEEHAVQPGKVMLRDYDYLQPSFKLESAAGGENEEQYDYPGNYDKPDDGDRYSRIILERHEARRQIVRGDGTCRFLQSGFKFDLKDHFRRQANRTYLLLGVRHAAHAGDHRSWDSGVFDYRNDFEAIPFDVPFRPHSETPKPVVQGSQTAVVVGKSGEEIWVDKYGRVKVQFFWDREGRKNENSSCWVRVSSAWAGKSWGFIQIPRIGQEVIVDFLEGDPDRPIITGRVYNAEQMPPYDLPADQTQSGAKSRSSKGGGAANFNEIRMEDKKGSEQLYIHAEKNKQVVVENDRNESVGHDETYDIGNDQSISIGNDRTEKVGNNESITVGKNRTESVGNDESITVGKNRTESVGNDESIKIGSNRSEAVGKDESVRIGSNRKAAVGKNETLSIGQNRSTSIGKNEDRSVGDSRSTQIAKDDQLQVGKNLVIQAGDSIVLKTGKASITMKKDGTIAISGKDISVKGTGKIDVKASKNITMKGQKILQN